MPRNIALELSRIARNLWTMRKEEDADCMQRLAAGEARQLAGELRQLGRVHDAHTVERLALDEGRSVAWKLQLELANHPDASVVELSSRIESLVTHAVLGQKEPAGAFGPSIDGCGLPDTGSLELQRHMKTLPSGKVLALEKVSAHDPWRVREVDGVACEMVCSALQEVYPQLSFAEAMRHLEEAEYDFEDAAKTLLTLPTIPIEAPHPRLEPIRANSVRSTGASALGIFPQDRNETIALAAYVCLLLLSFYAAHEFDSRTPGQENTWFIF